MSKVISATCAAGVVTADGLPVTGAVILSEGVAPSAGVLLMQGESHYFVAKTSPDLKTVIGHLNTILTNLVTVLTSHDGGLGSTQTATIALIATANTTLTTLKENLK